MFKIDLSNDMKKDSFSSNLNLLFSFKSTKKWSNFAFWLYNNIWSKIADSLDILTNLPDKGNIPRCFWTLSKMSLGFTTISCVAAATHEFIKNVWT